MNLFYMFLAGWFGRSMLANIGASKFADLITLALVILFLWAGIKA
jgi:hypothetical protein